VKNIAAFALALCLCTVALSAQELDARGILAIIAGLEAVAARLGLAAVDPPPLSSPPPPAGVTDAAGLTAALVKGGEIRLTPGTYAGNFVVTAPTTLTCAGVVLPTGRVAPSDVSACRIVALDPLKPFVTILSSSVRIQGLTMTGVAPDRTGLEIGSLTATDARTQPNDVIIDQNAILGANGLGHRGLALHGTNVTITRNHIAGWLERGRESQAVWLLNGAGPYTIVDNYLEASGENLMAGGDDPRIVGQVPSDIHIARNRFAKPLSWRRILNADGSVAQAGEPGSVKNLLEVKCGQRIIIEDNEFDGAWKDMQDGHAVLLTPRNSYGRAPWCVVQDVTIRRNRFTNLYDGMFVQLLGISDNRKPTGRTRNIVIEGNYADGPKGFIVNKAVEGLTIRRNTLPRITRNLFQFTGTDTIKTTLVVVENVFSSGVWGATGDGTTPGKPTLDAWAPGYTWTGNVLERTAARSITWPRGTQLLAPGALAPLLDANGHYVPGGAGW
jgi:hypothetical protein